LGGFAIEKAVYPDYPQLDGRAEAACANEMIVCAPTRALLGSVPQGEFEAVTHLPIPQVSIIGVGPK